MKRTFGMLALAGAVALALGAATAARASDQSVFKTTMSFDDVRQALSDAIVNRGYVIDHVSHISDMLKRTATAVGATRDIYVNAETVQFCSAVLSRRMMEADPANIVYCPYVIFTYETGKRARHRLRRPPGARPRLGPRLASCAGATSTRCSTTSCARPPQGPSRARFLQKPVDNSQHGANSCLRNGNQ